MSDPSRPRVARKTTGASAPLAKDFSNLRVASSGSVPKVQTVPRPFPKATTSASTSGSTPKPPSTSASIPKPSPAATSGVKRPQASASTARPQATAPPAAEKEEDYWYNNPRSSHPYELAAIITDPPGSAGTAQTRTWHQAAFFPWPKPSRPAFTSNKPEPLLKAWEKAQQDLSDTVALAGGDEVRLIKIDKKNPYEVVLSLHLEGAPGEKKRDRSDGTLSDRARAVTWAVDPDDLSVLLCFGGSGRLIYVWDVQKKSYRSCLRGHGQTIMHLTTHPMYPHIIASSARDRSTRIYDLTLPQSFPLTYAALPDGMPNRGNFPMGGLPVTKEGVEGVEGDGPGKCIAVVGWYVKGHRDAVVGADFHPTLPLLATCGLDHAVRIWGLPKLPIKRDEPWEMCAISDPLFGTQLLHSSPLDSIFWLADDILVSKSWDEYNNRDGSVVLWQWTELDRFFPPSQQGGAAEKRQVQYWERNRQPWIVYDWAVDNSRSFRELRRIRPTPQAQHTRLAVHHAFPVYLAPNKPAAPGLVRDLLLGWGGTTRTGSLWLVNPLLKLPTPAQQQQQQEGEGESPPVKEERNAEGKLHFIEPSGRGKWVMQGTDRWIEDVGWELSSPASFGRMAGLIPGMKELVREADPSPAPEDGAEQDEEEEGGGEDESDEDGDYQDQDAGDDSSASSEEYQAPRTRSNRRQKKEKEKEREKEKPRKLHKEAGDGVTIPAVAIRPRGARIVVGAGEYGTILVWRRKGLS